MAQPDGVDGGSRKAFWVRRLPESAVAWSWMFNGLRLASGLLLLPLLLKVLNPAELGLYYVFLQLATVVFLADFGFSLSVERGLAYALSGAKALTGQGMGSGVTGVGANEVLLRSVVRSAGMIYRGLAVAVVVFLAVVGTWVVGMGVGEVRDPGGAWVAWGVLVVATGLEVYSLYWVAVLRGLNEVSCGARWLTWAYGIKLGLGAGLLASGAGLLSVPLAGLAAGVVLRWGAGRAVRRRVPDPGRVEAGEVRRILAAIWPNSWRLGMQTAAVFLVTNVYSVICLATEGLGPQAYAEYGLSAQVMTLSAGIAGVWTSVKWPLVAQWRVRGEREAIRRLLAPRYRRQMLTFGGLAGMAILAGPGLLEMLSHDKKLLPVGLLVLMALNGWGELNFSFWTTLISTENRIPSAGPLVATQVGVALVAAGWVGWGGGGLEALVVAPLVLGGMFNYWWWSRVGARILNVTYMRFVLGDRLMAYGKDQ